MNEQFVESTVKCMATASLAEEVKKQLEEYEEENKVDEE